MFIPVEEPEKGQEESPQLNETSESQETIDDKPVIEETASTSDALKTTENAKENGRKLAQEEDFDKEVKEPCTPVATAESKSIGSSTCNTPKQASNSSKDSNKVTGKSPVREVLEIKETPVKTEGESTDSEPMDSAATSRHEECSGEQNEHGTAQAKTVETEQKNGDCQDKADIKETEKVASLIDNGSCKC